MPLTDTKRLQTLETNYVYGEAGAFISVSQSAVIKTSILPTFEHGGQFIDEVVMTSDVANAMGSFTLTDLRYSVYAVVDASGGLVERYQYDPYGSRTVMTAGYVELDESAIGQEFGYTGRRHDAEDTGLMYFRARYYSGELGRFVSRDPLGYVDGMNLYQAYFVVNGVDPSGEISLAPVVPMVKNYIKKNWKQEAGTKYVPGDSLNPGEDAIIEEMNQCSEDLYAPSGDTLSCPCGDDPITGCPTEGTMDILTKYRCVRRKGKYTNKEILTLAYDMPMYGGTGPCKCGDLENPG